MPRLIRMLIPMIALVVAQLACGGPGCPMTSFVVVGKIVDSEGNTIPNASVTIQGDAEFEASPINITIISDETGNFESELISGSTCSTYTISVSVEGYEIYETHYNSPALATWTPYALAITLNKADEWSNCFSQPPALCRDYRFDCGNRFADAPDTGILPDFMVNYLGDALWALVIFLGIGLLLPNRQTRTIFLLALTVTWSIEFSQFYQADWINAIRAYKLGGLILGYTFLPSDLLMYLCGVGAGVFLEKWLLMNERRNDVECR